MDFGPRTPEINSSNTGIVGTMGQAASLGSLSVPPAWTSAIPTAQSTGARLPVAGATANALANLLPGFIPMGFPLDGGHRAGAVNRLIDSGGKGPLSSAERVELARLRELVAEQHKNITSLKRALAYFAACQLG